MSARAALLLALACAAQLALAVPRFAQVKAAYRSSDTVVLDRHGQPLQRVRTDPRLRKLDWVPLQQVSPAFKEALLLSEDKRFYEHSGVDWPAIGAAAWGNLWQGHTRGASTLTMQLAGLLDDALAAPGGGRSLAVKVAQARLAWQIEQSWTKEQILEAYLNLVAFRGEVVGIGALSATLFKKIPSGLDAEESAIAAALVRAPNAKPALVARRACALLAAQGRGGPCEPLATYAQQVLASREPLAPGEQLAPHLARRLVAAAALAATPAPATLSTTLDADLQRFARDTLRRHLAELRGRHVEDGAVIVVDNASGDVLAWVGSSGSLSRAPEVDGVVAPRQAGSTLKPFLYETAIEQRWLTAASLIDDSPLDVATAAGLYLPENYDHSFKGRVSVRTALASSLNVPAVRTLMLVTPERFGQRLRAVGLPLKHGGDFYGYSLALGSAEVTLATLANAYRTLANSGAFTPLRTQPSDPAPPARQAMDAGASFIVSDILSDREARAPTFGLDNALSPRYWAAVKTGTSKDMRDNWCVGYSQRHTVGVWVGNAIGEPMWNVSGVTGAAPVWRAVMDELQRDDALKRPARASAQALPQGLVSRRLRFAAAAELPRDEWFLAGTEQALVTPATPGGSAGALIVSPTDKSTIALDPDIPLPAQRLRIAALAGTPSTWSWRLDGKRIGPAGRLDWPLWPGAHKLELVDQQGATREKAHFEVRGAQVKVAAQTRP